MGLCDFDFYTLANQSCCGLVGTQHFFILIKYNFGVGFGVAHQLFLIVRQAALSVIESHDPNKLFLSKPMGIGRVGVKDIRYFRRPLFFD